MDVTTIAKPSMPEGWVGLLVDVSKKTAAASGSGNEYVKIGEMTIPIPTLEAFGITNAAHRARTADDGEEDGMPLYTDDKFQWLYDAVVKSCKADARNKLIPQTAELKDGVHIANTFEDLIADGRVGGEHLKIRNEAIKAFSAWFVTLAKSVAATAMATKLFAKTDALSLQPADIKEKMKSYLSQFAESLEPADAERYGKTLLSVEEACSTQLASDF